MSKGSMLKQLEVKRAWTVAEGRRIAGAAS